MSEQMKPEYSNNVAKKVAFPNPLKKDIKSQPVDIYVYHLYYRG